MDDRIVKVIFPEPNEDTIRIISFRRAKSMKENNSTKPSKTDWARVDAMTDDEIDLSDSPELGQDFFANATWRMPKNETSITLSVDNDVLDWFK